MIAPTGLPSAPSGITPSDAIFPRTSDANAPLQSSAERAETITAYTGEKLTWNWRGYDIKYVAYGEGPPLVLLHGFGASIGHWRKNIPELAAAGHRVYALDLLGFGDSDKPNLDYSLEFWVKIIHDFGDRMVQEKLAEARLKASAASGARAAKISISRSKSG